MALVGIGVAVIPTSCAGDEDRSPSGRPAVVATTDVWASVAEAVAGPDASVTAVVTGPADPHSYEPPPATVAALTDADLVVLNGGGYDAWAQAVLDSHPSVPAVDAYSLLDATALGEPSPANEHVFYDLNTATAVAKAVGEKLAADDPAHAAGYRSRAEEFGRKADRILASERALRDTSADKAVVATEPVAHYLLLAAGLADKTPPGFRTAVEQDTDPAPADMAATLDLLSGGHVAALVFNDQTATVATGRVRDAARAAGVPVVAVTETLPPSTDYLGWQAATVERLAAALREGR